MWVRPVVIGLFIVSATVVAGISALGTNTSADTSRGSAAPVLAPIPTLLPPFPLCFDDAYEQNDSLESASQVSLPFTEAELSACPDDSDWFSFPVSAGGNILVDAVFSHADGNVDMLLKRPDGLVASYAMTDTDNESISYTAPVSGEYAVLVELSGDTPPDGNAYELHISISCPPDAFEDNDSQATAFPVTLPFTQSALRVCPHDRDWFSFHLDAGDDVLPYVSFINDKGDLDIYLHDPTGEIVSASESSFQDHESAPHTAEVSGAHALEVTLYADTPVEGNFYTLEINILADLTPTPTDTPANTPSPTHTATTLPTEAPTSTPSPTHTATTPPANTPTPTVSEGIPGDADCSTAVDSLDALLLLQLAAGLLDALPCPQNADVNEDGNTDALDAQLILQYGAGLIPTLPP